MLVPGICAQCFPHARSHPKLHSIGAFAGGYPNNEITFQLQHLICRRTLHLGQKLHLKAEHDFRMLIQYTASYHLSFQTHMRALG